MCGFSKRTYGSPAASFTNSIPAGFCSQKFWGLFFLALEPWPWWPGVGLGLLTPETSFLIFMHHMWVRDQLIVHLSPSYQSG